MPGPVASSPKSLWFTFGNHMHWVDMEWLWGYEVLPGSVDDMLRLVEATGPAANVNFDAVGYERMAAECPEALARLRAAVHDGRVEVVGGSYAQPYGLFHGGESNVRQLAYGVRAVLRHLGVRPRVFWEEEYDFFPQLPQLLRGCGYSGACLFFQWTWHTPEMPDEECALVLWEGIDGSRLPALPRNGLNLHQWPEDFAPILASPLLERLERPALVQWVELMPSPDWMCRSEVLLPPLRRLQEDPRFHLRPGTASVLLRELDDGRAPVRRYHLDETWHGMTLGKNGDRVLRESRRAEEALVAAEAWSVAAAFLGRPYPHWDVYPLWELEEAWRELLVAQHHDNHECEGLCGFLGHDSLARSRAISRRILERTLRHLAARVEGPAGALLVANPLGWSRDVAVRDGAVLRLARDVPAFGWRLLGPEDASLPPPVELAESGELVTLARRPLTAAIERRSGLLRSLRHAEFGELVTPPLPDLSWIQDGRPVAFSRLLDLQLEAGTGWPVVTAVLEDALGGRAVLAWSLHPVHAAVQLEFDLRPGARPDPGWAGALAARLRPVFSVAALRRDHPFAVDEARPEADRPRKYPEGDWMTSPQWFETVPRPFTAWSFVDLLAAGSESAGLLLAHDGSQGWQRTDDGLRVLLNAWDPWDGAEWQDRVRGRLWLAPHGALDDGERLRLARELAEAPAFLLPGLRLPVSARKETAGGDAPQVFAPVEVHGEGVLATTLHREGARAGEHLPVWAGADLDRPLVLRLLETRGRPARVRIDAPGGIARAVRTNLLGEPEEELDPADCRLELGSRAIATIYLDLPAARKQNRDLDARRRVWATVHRRDSSSRDA